ncbi:MAG: hypothetical protein BGN85_09470 [Alphaproteobacteria bacterium 64-11]|nr:MAG: hypothetical protein BGN85_09470 [Alphaproteobacteria bacterium 64-11]
MSNELKGGALPKVEVIDRRKVLTTIASASAMASGVAIAASRAHASPLTAEIASTAQSAGGNADAELFRLEGEYWKAHEQWLADLKPVANAGYDPANPLQTAADRSMEAVAAIHDAMIATPASTMGGLLAKLRAHRSWGAGCLSTEREVNAFFADIERVGQQEERA